MKRIAIFALTVAVAAACAFSLCSCGAKVQMDGQSPCVADVKLSTDSQMSESSQAISLSVTFDQQISVDGDPSADFKLLINGKEPDSSTVKVDVRSSANAITFTLRPSDSAAKGAGAGSYFAMYQAQFSLASARDDGALPHVSGQSGSTAVLPEAVSGTLPSGLSVNVDSQQAGTADSPATAVFTVSSPAKARVITWFSPDGGSTVLLKHNHSFAQSSTDDCAADLAKVINAADCGIVATAKGSQVALTATKAVEGQVIDPVVVEGVGVSGGNYDSSQGMGA